MIARVHRGFGSAAAWPLAARAQQRTILVVGVLGSPMADALNMVAFMQGLKEAGFIEGQNLAVEQHWAENQYDRLPEMAADLVRARVSLIVAFGNKSGRSFIDGALQTHFQLIHDLVFFGDLVNPANPSNVANRDATRDAVRTWGGTVEFAYARVPRDFDAAFA